MIAMANNIACEIIEILGGTAATARLAGVKSPSVSAWKKNGIPDDRLVFLAPSIEQISNGKYNRINLFPDKWKQIWPELAKGRQHD